MGSCNACLRPLSLNDARLLGCATEDHRISARLDLKVSTVLYRLPELDSEEASVDLICTKPQTNVFRLWG